jgi:hypothetical protein
MRGRLEDVDAERSREGECHEREREDGLADALTHAFRG